MFGYEGNDSITNTGSSVTVYGNEGKDTINSSGSNVLLYGDEDKDIISLSGSGTKNTIIGGTGNDSVYSSVTSGVLYKYAVGDGNDYIKGWTSKDTLTITGGAYKTSTTSSNVIVSVEGGAKITLEGAKGKPINIKSSSSSTSNLVSSEILFEDDNFVADTAQIDSVTELSDKNYSVGKLTSLTGYDIFSQTESLVTAIYNKK